MKVLFLILFGIAAAGCVLHGHGHVVVVGHSHVCDYHCDHYYYGGTWYVSHGHAHGPGCGHVMISGRWVIH
jgi:hypothetical protein